MKIFYFTATGNSLYIAKQFGGELYSIPQLLKSNELVFEDDVIGLVFPCYGLAAPYLVREFIARATLKSPYIFTVMTYGNTFGDSAGWFKDFAAKNNVNINYCDGILMVDNYLPMFDIAKQKAEDKHIPANLARILDDIKAGKNYIRKGGLGDKLFSFAVHTYLGFKPSSSLVKDFYVTDKCNSCKTCVKVCPKDNICVPEGGKPIYSNHCEFCLACINLCPQHAIELPVEKDPARGRFKNENINLKEIIDANN
ncbi:ferredoxin [Elusimicrobium simillimum]|uniref:EFR1 family ferrodoxin n=1 Tax=Elusimicrobium simillimum TaxID=3143438 RepID=UPI003C704044